MSISVETYIVISLMFAVFAAVAAVGTSVVLGAGFERLRAGFELVRRQSGFFADAIHKLDQRTTKLDEETAKLKSGLTGMDERVVRVEKSQTFLADAISSIESRILQGSPAQQGTSMPQTREIHLHPANTVHTPPANMQQNWNTRTSREPDTTIASGLFRDFPEEAPRSADHDELPQTLDEPQDTSGGLTVLLSRYFLGESSGSGKGVVYH
jgi:hypothetical protein